MSTLKLPVGDVPDRTERMVGRDPRFQRHVTEHRSWLLVGSTHWSEPFVSASIVVRGDRKVDPFPCTLLIFFSSLLGLCRASAELAQRP